MSDRRRPLDEAEWPAQLTARVLTPGERPHLHGYDVEGDLARHYPFGEVVLLALTGELPTEAQARAFDVALSFVSPAPIHEAPTHAAALARVCAGSTSSIQATAAIGLAEQARALVEAQRAWIDAVGRGAAAVADEAQRATSAEERRSVDRLREALRGILDVPALDEDLGREAAWVATFVACGLRRAEQIECALVFARLPMAVAEALATPPGTYRDYPLHLPPIEYRGGEAT